MSDRSITLANRIADILLKLNSGEILEVKELARIYSVSERTIQKDLNQRLDPGLIDELGGGRYRLHSGYLGNLTSSDIKEFSEVSGIIDLYPDMDDVLFKKIRSSLLVKSRINRGCIPSSSDFREINYTIANNLKLKFFYKDNLTVEPYKLINSGIWYLLGKTEEGIKSYCVHKMRKVRRDINSFIPDKNIVKSIESDPSPWFRLDKVDVELEIDKSFKGYFLDRSIIEDFKNNGEDIDGNLRISLKVNIIDEISGTIKYWLPNIRVISPNSLKEKINNDIKKYLNEPTLR